jgi:hypothetical protein
MEIFTDHKIPRTARVGIPMEVLLPGKYPTQLDRSELPEDLFGIFNVLGHSTD